MERAATPGQDHPATDLQEAINEAVKVAEQRGDTESVQRIREREAIEVLDASYVKLPSVADTKAAKRAEIEARVAEVIDGLRGEEGDDLSARLSQARDLLDELAREAFSHGV